MRVNWILGLMLGLGGLGCSSDVITTSSGGQMAMGGRSFADDDDSSTGGDPMGGGGAGGGMGGEGGAEPTQRALIAAVSVGPPLPVSSTVVAGFGEALTPSPCVVDMTYGACEVASCALEAQTFTDEDAGTITVVGDVRTATLKYNGTNYDADESTQRLFNAGSTVTFTTTGTVDYPAINESLIAPSEVDVTAPSFVSPMVIDRSQDMVLSWTGGTSGVFWVTIAGYVTNESTVVSCRFDAVAGMASVPAAALGHLPATSNGAVLTGVDVSKEIVTGRHPATLRAAVPATSADSAEGYAGAIGSDAIDIQ